MNQNNEHTKIVRWVIKYSMGLIEDEDRANYFLIGFVVVAITVSLFLIFGGTKSKIPSSPPPTPFQNEKF